MIGDPPPYSLALHPFPLRALCSLAGRAPIGGGREIVMGCYMCARLASGMLPPLQLAQAARATRAAAAKSWFASLTLPATLRLPFARVLEASSGTNRAATAAALRALLAAATAHLDDASRREMEGIAARLEG